LKSLCYDTRSEKRQISQEMYEVYLACELPLQKL